MSQLGKIHNIDFQLNARTGSSFSSSFTKAQQDFAKLGQEIQNLNKVQSDISAYQKQQSAVQNTDAKLQNLQKQYDLIQREIEETDGPTAGLEREQAKLEQRIRDTTASLERQEQKLKDTSQRLEEAEVNTNDLTGESARLTGQLEDLRQRQRDIANSAQDMSQAHREAEEAAEDFGGTAADAFSAAQQALASAGIAAGLHEIYEAYSECVSIAAGFEQSMSTVEALSGAASGELQQLSTAAKKAGAETSFTALQSADAFQYMSLAGWNTNQMLAGLQPILDLSAAANMDLAAASDIVTDYLTAFGLTAQDTGKFVDQMAYAMANSNTNVVQLGEAYKNVASTAKSMHYSVEDTTAVIMTMADAGVKGGEAGTALNAIMTRLATDTKGCASALAEYGVEVYDAQGNMRSLSSILNGVSSIWSDLTDQQQANLAKIIAGTNQYSALQTIMTGCSEAAAKSGKSFNDYAAALQNCSGTAGRMASTMLDNLNGQMTLMDSAADALKTTIGEQFTPELRKLAEVGTDVLTWVNNFVQEHPALVKGVMAFTGVMGTAAVAVTGVNAALMAFKALNVAALFTGPVGAILGVSAVVAGVAASVVGMTTAIDDGIPSVRELTGAAHDMSTAMDEAGVTYEQTAGQTLAAAQVAETYIAKLEELDEGTDASNEHSRAYLNTLSLLCNAIPELTEYVNLETGAVEGGTEALREQTEAWKKNAETQAYQEYMNDLMGQYNEVMTESAANSIKLTEAKIKLEKIEKAREADLARLNELESKSVALTNEEQTEYYRLQDSLVGYNSELLNAANAVKTYTEAVEKDSESLAEAETALNDAQEAYEHLTGAMENQAGESEAAIRMAEELESAISPIRTELNQMTTAYNEAYEAAMESISGQYNLWDKADKVVATSASSINTALKSQISYWEKYNANLQTLTDNAADIEGLSDMVASFADGSQNSVSAIAGMADALNKGDTKSVRAMVANWQALQEQQAQTSESLAELVSGVPELMEELVSDIEEGVKDMSMPDEAQESARKTIQAFIDEASAMTGPVRDAYIKLAKAAADSLGVDLNVTNRASAKGSGYNYFDIPGHSGGVEKGYAAGTSNAPPGWAWVGEEGPELIHMRGGETVLPAEISREFAVLSEIGWPDLSGSSRIAAYANGTNDAAAAVMPEIAITPAEQQAAMEAERLTEISNAAYANYSEAVYNNAAYNTVRRADYTAYASPREAALSTTGAIEAVPVPSGGGAGPIKFEIHIHIEGNASPETVQALEDCVRRGEIQEECEKAWERMQVDARRKDWF